MSRTLCASSAARAGLSRRLDGEGRARVTPPSVDARGSLWRWREDRVFRAVGRTLGRNHGLSPRSLFAVITLVTTPRTNQVNTRLRAPTSGGVKPLLAGTMAFGAGTRPTNDEQLITRRSWVQIPPPPLNALASALLANASYRFESPSTGGFVRPEAVEAAMRSSKTREQTLSHCVAKRAADDEVDLEHGLGCERPGSIGTVQPRWRAASQAARRRRGRRQRGATVGARVR